MNKNTKKTRIDEVKDKRIRNIDTMTIIDKQNIEIIFKNGETITLSPRVEEFGYDSSIVIKSEIKQ